MSSSSPCARSAMQVQALHSSRHDVVLQAKLDAAKKKDQDADTDRKRVNQEVQEAAKALEDLKKSVHAGSSEQAPSSKNKRKQTAAKSPPSTKYVHMPTIFLSGHLARASACLLCTSCCLEHPNGVWLQLEQGNTWPHGQADIDICQLLAVYPCALCILSWYI